MAPMGKRPVDLFDDAPWPTEIADAADPSPRSALVASLVLVVLLTASMALPWFHGTESPPWTPFAHWLDRGWSPGTQDWGFLMLALSVATTVVLGFTIRSPRRLRVGVLVVLATALVVVVALEDSAHLPMGDGPNLDAYYGAWIGTTFAAFAWILVAIGALVALFQERRCRPRPPEPDR
jgi:hypothetical protein